MNFQGKRIAKRDWFMRDIERVVKQADLHSQKLVPESIEVFLAYTPLRACLRDLFGSHWTVLRVLFVSAVKTSIDDVRGSVWRFWRYRILMKSQDADLNDMISQTCPKCMARGVIEEISEDMYKCPNCSGVFDFEDLIYAQPDEED